MIKRKAYFILAVIVIMVAYSLPAWSVTGGFYGWVPPSTGTNSTASGSGRNLAREHFEASQNEKIPSGMKKVGADISAGEYVLFSYGSEGYFCVSADSNKENILFNDIFQYCAFVTVYDGEYLELQDCSATPIEDVDDLDLTKTGGMYKIGKYISAGEYKLKATSGDGYYCIYSNSRQDYIVANNIFDGETYVTVSDGQYLKLQDCQFSSTPSKPATETDVKAVQEKLNELGYDCGTADGIAGQKTQAAVKQYQQEKGITVTGQIDEELLNTLLEEQVVSSDNTSSNAKLGGEALSEAVNWLGKTYEEVLELISEQDIDLYTDNKGHVIERKQDLSAYWENTKGTEILHFNEEDKLYFIDECFSFPSDTANFVSVENIEKIYGSYRENNNREIGITNYYWDLDNMQIVQTYNYNGSDKERDDGIMDLHVTYMLN